MGAYRTTQLDPDYRRDPKTQDYCVRCQKDMKASQRRRWVRVVGGGALVLHPDDVAAFEADAEAMRGDVGGHPVGMDCARKVGLEFTYPESAFVSQPSLPTQGADQ